MHRIVFLDRSTIAPQIRLRRPAFEHELVEHANTRPDEVVARLPGASVAILNKVPTPATVLAAVARSAADRGGGHRLPTASTRPYCEAHGIAVSNIRGYAVNTVPEHAFALIFALRRNVIAYREDVIAGRWQQSGQFCFFDHPIHDLAGARLGIIGEGVLGQRVAEIARALGMVPMFAAHKGRSGLGPLYTPWDEVLETSDIITLHSPLTRRDARHDRNAGVPRDEATAADHQHRARWPRRRSRPGAMRSTKA